MGLVGKPSAGKSTFYNAVTRAALDRDGRRLADVAPHPFTTIEPNVGPGWFAGPDDDDGMLCFLFLFLLYYSIYHTHCY